ncbi:MAG: hypothetical protein Q7R66_14370 [Undibacterium sp.]|uniref:hypothetical protein n=1 Tax=Undibacterium sp. TaxID=1914977 RepID=UPI002717C289|nr:hypothetical protein [Undibacterium sp.]MDO8653367.1 hypothetical protein [Undibacterium sp.]
MANSHPIIVPGELVWLNGRPLLKMVEITEESLSLPFWSQTLAAKIRVAGLISLDESGPEFHAAMTLGGFVYHFNRCGSTLVSNVFSALNSCISISEPFVFQQLLDSSHGTLKQRVNWLRQLMALHLDALAAYADYLVIKWPGLMALYIADIESAFPRVPTIFLYRNPVEVLVSARLNPLGNTDIVKEVHLGLPLLKNINDYSPLERTAKLMANMCRHVLLSSNIKLLDYACLPDAIWTHVAPYFNIHLSPSDVLTMRECGRFHSKSHKKNKIFSDDAWTKRAMANEDELRVSNEIIEPVLLKMVDLLPSLCVPKLCPTQET